MGNRQFFPALTSLFALACCLATLTYLITLNAGIMGTYYPQVLLVYAPLLYGINRLFLRKERSMLSITALNGGLWIALVASICILEWDSGIAALVFAAIFTLIATVRAAYLAVEGTQLRGLIVTLDITALLLVLFTSYLAATEASYLWGLPIAAGFAAGVLGLTANRMGRPMGVREWGLVGGAFLLITLLVLLLVGVAAAPVGQGLVTLWTLLVNGVTFVWKLLWQFLLFLSSLIPGGANGEQQAMDQAFVLPEMAAEEPMGQENPVVLVLFVVLLVVMFAALVVWVLRWLSRLRVGGQRKQAKQGQRGKKRRLSLWAALRRLFSARLRQLRMLRYLRRHRDQPVGLYYILVRRCRMGPWHKRPGETPREFLTRLHGCAQEDGALEDALRQLIPLVDQALYAAAPCAASVPHAALIRRRIGRAVRGQFVRNTTQRLREGLGQLTDQRKTPTA